MLKNNGTSTYAIKDGNAQSGGLATRYNGALPTQSGYRPMTKQGAIILGIGGDNSNGSVGSFFEGVMTSGYPSDATENSVQANIVSVGYSKSVTFPVNGATYRLTNLAERQGPRRRQLRHGQRHPDRPVAVAGQHLPAVALHQRRREQVDHHERQRGQGPRRGQLRPGPRHGRRPVAVAGQHRASSGPSSRPATAATSWWSRTAAWCSTTRTAAPRTAPRRSCGCGSTTPASSGRSHRSRPGPASCRMVKGRGIADVTSDPAPHRL